MKGLGKEASKANLKGIAVWIWVIAGIIVGIIVFTIFLQLVNYTANVKEVQLARTTLDQMVYSINGLCDTFGGAKMTKTFTFPDIVSKVYATDDSKILNLVNGRSYGNVLCINMTTDFACENLKCQAELSDIGTKNNLLGIVNRLLGGFQSFDYKLDLQKIDCRVSVINSGEVPENCS